MHERCKNRANITSTFPYLEHLQANDHSFLTITEPLRKKLGETFSEGLK